MYTCELMAPDVWTYEKCLAYARSWSATCRVCPSRPALQKVRDPFRDYEQQSKEPLPIHKPISREEDTMAPKKGICSKCEEERTLVKDNQCTGCTYGADKDLTKEQVMEKKRNKTANKGKPVGLPSSNEPIKTTTTGPMKDADVPEKKVACFICGIPKWQAGPVGVIALNDGAKVREIYICHSCACKGLQSIAIECEPETLQSLLSDLLFQRALDKQPA